jgi:hypothetical protein
MTIGFIFWKYYLWKVYDISFKDGLALFCLRHIILMANHYFALKYLKSKTLIELEIMGSSHILVETPFHPLIIPKKSGIE